MRISDRSRGVVIGVSGLISGLFASTVVNWESLPKAALAMGVAVAVSMVIWFLLRPRLAP